MQWKPWVADGDASGYMGAYVVYMAFGLLFACTCAILVNRLAPYAAGSGIPEVRALGASRATTKRLHPPGLLTGPAGDVR
jgi:H+/Cl- antiporter ClcA